MLFVVGPRSPPPSVVLWLFCLHRMTCHVGRIWEFGQGKQTFVRGDASAHLETTKFLFRMCGTKFGSDGFVVGWGGGLAPAGAARVVADQEQTRVSRALVWYDFLCSL